MNNQPGYISLRKPWAIIKHRWFILVACIAITAAPLSIATYMSRYTTYSAESGYFIDTRDIDFNESVKVTAVGFATSSPVLEEASNILGGKPTVVELKKIVSSKGKSSSFITVVTAIADNEADAMKYSNAVTDAVLKLTQEKDSSGEYVYPVFNGILKLYNRATVAVPSNRYAFLSFGYDALISLGIGAIALFASWFVFPRPLRKKEAGDLLGCPEITDGDLR